MKTFKFYAIALFFCTFLTYPLLAQDLDSTIEPRERLSLVSMQGTVTDIVKETRDVTLKGANGELVTVTAGPEVKRFDEITVGDVITFDYYTYLKAEFRTPTATELAEPFVVLEGEDKAPAGEAPAAAVGEMVKAIVTIEILNRPQMMATVEGPNGNYLTIPMTDAAFMEKLHIGQVVILTYAEAIAVSLTKVE
ncbi:hypothetical protein [uncultured Eudoraea sp.]|jgi:hypothetical protein|uniref:hypothetical protein n=1 Tax=uncultured Eudoraea sp. TaxID=1035614 RepID=UPI00260313CF|nr:hypothetical protein [uncultured Eudoraea sp.]